MNIMQWKTKGLAAVLAISLLGLPQVVAAQEHYSPRDRSGGAYPGRYDSRYGCDYGYDRGYPYARPRVESPGPWSGYSRNGYAPEGYRGDNYNSWRGDYDDRYERSPGKSAAIVGGSAAAGAVFGELAGGGKGAAIGAAIGGIGGLIIDQASRDRH